MITIGLYTNENERIFRMLDDFLSNQDLFYRILSYSSAEELFNVQEKYYVLFWDIDCSYPDGMPGMDGVEIAKKVRYVNRGVTLIFTSRQKDNLLRAINEAHPFAFLVRPISKKQLIFQMNELKTFINYQIKKDDIIKLKLINLSEDGVLGFDYKKIAIRDIFCLLVVK